MQHIKSGIKTGVLGDFFPQPTPALCMDVFAQRSSVQLHSLDLLLSCTHQSETHALDVNGCANNSE